MTTPLRQEAGFGRRRIVVAFTLSAGCVFLGFSLAAPPGAGRFYLLTLLVAATWIGGAVASGPLHMGRASFTGRRRRPVVIPVVLGLGAGLVFAAGALVVRDVPALREPVTSVLAHERYGSIGPVVAITLLNGVTEEMFFRGALFDAIGRRLPVITSTIVYAAATAAIGNLMLVFAAFWLGLLLGLQRRITGSVLAPILTHVTWSTMMLFLLPHLIRP